MAELIDAKTGLATDRINVARAHVGVVEAEKSRPSSSVRWRMVVQWRS